jgi:membrane associated rhomboid family serine protease
MSFLSPACVILGLYLAFTAGLIFLRNRSTQRPRARRFPLATLLLIVAIALPTTLQFFYPAILTALQRDYTRFAGGEWWRVITPLFVQDGGVPGSLFNLVTLLLVGAVAENLWGGKRMIGIFFVGGIVSEVLAFAWQPIGAGNSVGNFSLAASVAIACLVPQARGITHVVAVLALSADAVLLILRDIHGAAAATGVILAFALKRLDKKSAKKQ